MDKRLIRRFLQAQGLPQDQVRGKKRPAAFQVRVRHPSPMTSRGLTQGARRQSGSRHRKLIIICLFVKARARESQYVTKKRGCMKKPSLSMTL